MTAVPPGGVNVEDDDNKSQGGLSDAGTQYSRAGAISKKSLQEFEASLKPENFLSSAADGNLKWHAVMKNKKDGSTDEEASERLTLKINLCDKCEKFNDRHNEKETFANLSQLGHEIEEARVMLLPQNQLLLVDKKAAIISRETIVGLQDMFALEVPHSTFDKGTKFSCLVPTNALRSASARDKLDRFKAFFRSTVKVLVARGPKDRDQLLEHFINMTSAYIRKTVSTTEDLDEAATAYWYLLKDICKGFEFMLHPRLMFSPGVNVNDAAGHIAQLANDSHEDSLVKAIAIKIKEVPEFHFKCADSANLCKLLTESKGSLLGDMENLVAAAAECSDPCDNIAALTRACIEAPRVARQLGGKSVADAYLTQVLKVLDAFNNQMTVKRDSIDGLTAKDLGQWLKLIGTATTSFPWEQDLGKLEESLGAAKATAALAENVITISTIATKLALDLDGVDADMIEQLRPACKDVRAQKLGAPLCKQVDGLVGDLLKRSATSHFASEKDDLRLEFMDVLLTIHSIKELVPHLAKTDIAKAIGKLAKQFLNKPSKPSGGWTLEGKDGAPLRVLIATHASILASTNKFSPHDEFDEFLKPVTMNLLGTVQAFIVFVEEDVSKQLDGALQTARINVQQKLTGTENDEHWDRRVYVMSTYLKTMDSIASIAAMIDLYGSSVVGAPIGDGWT
jgi:hypothetical protein